MPNNNKRCKGSGDDVNVVVEEKDCPQLDADLKLVALLNHQPHPLIIPHIIETVFDYLFGKLVHRHVPDLRACRLVCSRWNEIVTKLYRKHAEDLVFGDKFGKDSKKMQKFLSDFENTFDNPIQTYRFDPGFFVQKNESLLHNFFYSCTSWIVTLKVWFDSQSDLRFPKRCYPNLKLDCLEYLFFGCVNYRGTCSTERMELTYILDALLVAATKLKKFCFSFPPKDIRSQQAMVKRFGDVISTKTPKSVKNLKLEMKLTDIQVDSLSEIGLALEVLHCDFRGSILTSDTLLNLFSRQQSTLQEMRLLDSEIKYAFELRFPRFEKLTVFEIQGGTIAPFSYKDNFPVLERLLLFGWENEKTNKSMLESTTTPCDTLTSLEFPYKIQDKNIVCLAARCFPNLKKLEITPTHEGMQVVASIFANLTQLEELEITFPFIIEMELNVDPIFSGMTLEDCEKLWGSETGFQTANYSELQKHPSIANLTKLKRLTILDHSNEIRLTDITAFFGLLKLSSLEVLEMGRFDMSCEIFQALKDKVRLSENYESSDSGSDVSFTSDDSDFDQPEVVNISDDDDDV